MRLLLLALAVTLTAGYSNRPVQFSPGKTYIFKYEAEMQTMKDRHLPLARAGIKITSDVWLSSPTNTSVIMKFHNTAILESLGYTQDHWIRADRLSAKLAPEFEKTIKFEYKNGNVDKFAVPANSSLFSNNIKKSVASILQMTLKDKMVYYMQEVGPQGTCKTTYLLTSEPQVTKVTKTRNLRECLNPVVKSSGLAYTDTCPECLSIKRAISGSDSYKYILNHTDSGLLISSVASTEQILFNPLFDKDDGTIMESKQWLRLTKINDGQILPTPGYYLPTSREYKFSQKDETFPFSLDFTSAEAQATELLEHLANNNNQSVDVRAPLEFAKLARLLRRGRRDLMDSLWSRYNSSPNYRRVLTDVIPYEKSAKSLKFIIERFDEEALTPSEAAQMLVVNLQVIEVHAAEVWGVAKSLIQHPKILQNDLVRKVSLLGYGSVIYRWCKNKSPCMASLALDPLHEMLDKAIVDSDSETIKLLIKSLSNAAHPSSLKKIIMLLPGFGRVCGILGPEVIVDAVLALRRFAKVVPREVEQIGTRLVLNRDASPEVRMAAMMAVFDSNPSMGLVTTLATHLKLESNLQVRHFAVTLMAGLSMSNVPDRSKLGVACKHGLGILNTIFPRLRPRDLSTAFTRSVWNPRRMAGASVFLYALKNYISPIPKNSIYRHEFLVSGLRLATIEGGARINGLLESVLKVTDGSTSREEKMLKIARILSSADPKLLRRLESEIYLAPWSQTIIYFDPLKTIADITSQRSALSIIIDSLRLISQGFSWNAFKGIMPTDVSYMMATSTGLPFSVNGIITGVGSASLAVKGGTSPPWSEINEIREDLANISLKANAHLSAKIDAVYGVGIRTPEIEAQLVTHASVSVDLPIAVELKAELKKKKYSLRIKEVQQKDILTALTETVASVQTEMDPLPRQRPIISPVPVEELSSVSASPAEDTSGSSESIVLADMPTKVKRWDTIPDMTRKTRNIGEVPGGILVLDYHYRSTSSDPTCISCKISGMNGMSLSIKDVENKIKETEIILGLGSEAEKLMTEFNPIEEKEPLEDTNVLMKLRKILAPGLKNQTSSSSSSASYSAESSRPSTSQSSSSSESLESSSLSASSEAGRQTLIKYPTAVGQLMWSMTVRAHRENGSTIYSLSLYQDINRMTVKINYINLVGRKTWQMHIESVWEKDQRIQVTVHWGSGNQYQIRVTVDAGNWDTRPKQLVIKWGNVPPYMRDIATDITHWVAKNAHEWGWQWSKAQNPVRTITAYAVNKENEIIVHWNTPHWDLLIPIINPPSTDLISEAYVQFNAAEGNLRNKMLHMISNTNAAKCSLNQDTVVTFNNRQFKSEMPHICNQILAQDCTAERKFLVQLKKDLVLGENEVNVLVADIDVSIRHRGNAIGVTVNGIEIPVNSLPYQHPTGTISITRQDEGIALFAARHGLNEVFLGLNGLQIKVPDWMRGQTCGMCGHGDGELIEEYRTPNGRLATSALSFTQSWVVPGTGCNDISKCYLTTKSVKLDKQITLNGQESKCYSVEPVLRCQPGCTPVRTTSVQVGYHCVPAEASVNRAESLSSIFKKSVDVTEKAVAHLACRCSPQCA